MPDDYLGLHKKKMMEATQLHNRMDGDENLLFLKDYVLTDVHSSLVPDIINVTLNRPGVFAANILAELGRASQQIVVTSRVKSIDTHYIEDFQNSVLRMADDRLETWEELSLNDSADIQLCLRGRAARRVLTRVENGVFIPDIVPWDTRSMTFEYGMGGLKWAAYEMKRSKSQVEEQYGIVTKQEEAEVLDVWDAIKNEIWIDGTKVRTEEHGFGYCPVVLSTVSLGYGSSLKKKGNEKYVGESIFFLIRGLIPELNRLVSILQTLNMKAVKAPLQFKNKGGPQATPPEYDEATAMGSVTAVDTEGGLVPIEYGDAKTSATMLYNMLEKYLQEGSISSIDLGNLSFPLSAVALVEIGEGKDQVFLPRLTAKAKLNRRTAQMFTQQVLDIGGSIEIGTQGHKQTFDMSKLKGEYETTYKYYVKSPKIDIARMSIAQQAEKWYDPQTILEDVLQVEDPKEIMRRRYYYLAEELDLNVKMKRTIVKLLEMAEEGDIDAGKDAELMAHDLGISLDQAKLGMLQPIPQQQAQVKTTAASSMLPLLGPGGQVGQSSSKRASELRQTPVGG